MVTVRNEETIDSLIRRFKKQVDDEGILKEYREKEFFMKKSLKRHQEKRRVQRRNKSLNIKIKEKKQL